MTARLLQWQAGCAGDIIMYLMQLSGINIANTRYTGVSESGGTIIDANFHQQDHNPVLVRISRDIPFLQDIDSSILKEEISRINNCWLKSHHYCPAIDDVSVEIEATLEGLPFIIQSVIDKTNAVQDIKANSPIRIRDADVLLMFAAYSIGAKTMSRVVTTTTKPRIKVEAIYQGWDSLYSSLQKVNIQLLDCAKPVYDTWNQRNQSRVPSKHYLDLLKNNQFNYTDPQLSLSEKYSLLIASGSKFKVLK